MGSYFIRRLFWVIPTVWIISLLAFFMSNIAPIDPPNLNSPSLDGANSIKQIRAYEKRNAKKLNLDKPAFYFSFQSLAEPDTFHTFYFRSTRDSLRLLLYQNGDWPAIQRWRQGVLRLREAHINYGIHHKDPLIRKAINHSYKKTNALLKWANLSLIETYLDQIESSLEQSESFHPIQVELDSLRKCLPALKSKEQRWKNYVPSLVWHGFHNQYHAWLSAVISRGDLGLSWQGHVISERIGALFRYSCLFAFLSFILAFGLGIPLGLLAVIHYGKWPDRWIGLILFGLHSVPSFWAATLLLMFFANPDILNWFYSSFNTYNPGFWAQINRAILPLIAYSYAGLAVISRTLRLSLLEQIQSDYMRTARAKGLSQWQALYKHALRNALIPMLTLFMNLFPALIGGSIVLETIFQIPGMGQEIYKALLDNDMPYIMAIFILIGLLTVISYLVADFLYTWVDPRIRFDRNNRF